MYSKIFFIICLLALSACSNDNANPPKAAKKATFDLPDSNPFKPLTDDLKKAKAVQGIMNDRTKNLDKLLK